MSDLTQWTYKRSHSITSGTTLTDYQVKIRVYRTEGTSAGDTVYLGSKCLANYGDIRFVASDNTTELPYWMETNAGTYADFWVKVDSITSDSSIYIYYGNSSATTTSNGDTTFPFFDDFTGTTLDTSKWTGYVAGATVSNGTLSYTSSSDNKMYSILQVGTNHAIRSASRLYGPGSSNQYNELRFMKSDLTQNTIGIFSGNGTSSQIRTYNNGTTTTLSSNGNSNKNIYSIYRYDSSAKFTLNDINMTNSPISTNLPSGDLRIGFLTSGGSSYRIETDYIIIHKCSTTEPTHVSWSDEQEVITYPLRITITPTTGTDPLSVTYNLSISEALDNFVLNFGDGETYTGDDITSFATTHTYTTPGTYTVWAEGYNEFATHVYYEIPYGVTVNAKAVVASFTTSQSYNTITFTNTSTGNINEWFWTFGDGNHSYEQNPIHTYWSPATYTVTLHASNQYQYDTYTTTVTVTQILTPPEVYFTPNNLNVINPALPYSVTFTNLSTPTFGCTYNWLIDGTSYTTQDASHSFPSVGMYDVGLTVTNALGSATKTYTDAIRITRKGKTFYEVINYADTPATFHVEVFVEYATNTDTIIQAHIFDESINFVQDEIPDEPGLDEWGMRHFYTSINEWGHRIINAVTDWGHRILYNGSTLDNSPVTLFKAQEFREDVVFIDEWQFGTT